MYDSKAIICGELKMIAQIKYIETYKDLFKEQYEIGVISKDQYKDLLDALLVDLKSLSD